MIRSVQFVRLYFQPNFDNISWILTSTSASEIAFPKCSSDYVICHQIRSHSDMRIIHLVTCHSPSIVHPFTALLYYYRACSEREHCRHADLKNGEVEHLVILMFCHNFFPHFFLVTLMFCHNLTGWRKMLRERSRVNLRAKKLIECFQTYLPYIKDTYDLTQGTRELATKDCMGNKIQHRPLSKLEPQITHFCESNYV